jgi:multidrug resistance efflux pump
MKKKLSLGIIFVMLVMAVSACASGNVEADAAAAPEPQFLIAEGSLVPVTALDMSFSVSGQVEKIWIEDGQKVRKYQVLANLEESPALESALADAQQAAIDARLTLDDYVAQKDVSLAQTEIEMILARSRFRNARNDYWEGATQERRARMEEKEAEFILADEAFNEALENEGLDPDQLAMLQANLTAALAAEEKAEDDLDALKLRAPMNGIVVDIDVEAGQKVNTDEVLMMLADFSQWTIETDSLTEIEVVDVSLGQPVEVVLDALPDSTLNGVVSQINERFEEKRGDITYTVTIDLQDTHPQMRWGMTAAVYFLPVEE